ncbi:kinase-like domain-containing protein [Biscogniauxia mediterranea]|nr:kinase-like domain-containing protein [Biscogniauxia mediterranea]
MSAKFSDPLFNLTLSNTSSPQSEGKERVRWFRAGQFDMFKFYRQGKYWPFSSRWERKYSYPDLPLKGRPQVEMPGQRQRLVNYYKDERERADLDNMEEDDVENDDLEAWETIQLLKTSFQIPGVNIRYKNCIGWGGQGLVSAFDILAPSGQLMRKVVVKAHFPDTSPARVESERKAMRSLSKSEHIVQLLYAERDGQNPDKDADDVNGNNEDTEMDDYSEERPLTVLVMEMMEHGDLADFIIKVCDHNEKVPNTILWRFLLCLVRMCIAMAYPPARRPENVNVPGPIRETIPKESPGQPARIVHFDFDPYNILIGGVSGNNEHGLTPILKLGDFGAASEVKGGEKDLYYERLRMKGKMGYFAPEQFCTDWDYIPRDSNLVSQHKIAGNYGPHTNVWGIGLIMETLITLSRPAVPPAPSETSWLRPPSKASYHTYAWHLTEDEYGNVDADLRGLVLRLQAHLPEDRPSLSELEAYVRGAAASRKYPNETPEAIKRWLIKILLEPPPSSPPSSPEAPPQPDLGKRMPGPVRNTPRPVFFQQGNQIPPWASAPSAPPPPRVPQAPQQTVIKKESKDDGKPKASGSQPRRSSVRYHPYGVPPNMGKDK